MIIAVSGVDCSGKSTQIGRLSSSFDDCRAQVIWGRYGYTPGIEALKKVYRYLCGKKRENVMWMSVNERVGFSFIGLIWKWASIVDFLFYYGVVVRVLDNSSKTIILDRFLIDFFVDYELFHHKKVGSLLERVTRLVLCKPKFSFLLSVDVDTSLERMACKNDPFPVSEESLVKGCRLYQEYCRSELIIDASRGVDEVFEDIRSYIEITT